MQKVRYKQKKIEQIQYALKYFWMMKKEKMHIDSHKNTFKNSKGNFKERIKLNIQ